MTSFLRILYRLLLVPLLDYCHLELYYRVRDFIIIEHGSGV